MSPDISTLMAAALLAGEAPAFFGEVTALLVVGAVIAYAGFRFGLVPIVGFLIAGVLIGPHSLGLVRDPALVDAAAEVGVILLLFTIGIEFSLEKLGRIRRLIFVGGGLQTGLATLLPLGMLALLGVDWRTGLYTGFLIALSSTAIVLKLLADRAETDTEHGRTIVGVLIFQDLAVVAMVLLVPMLGGDRGSALDVGWALGKAALIIAAVLIFARRIMPRILEAVARTCSPEIFLLTVIAICFGTAWLTSVAGVSLSLGAFLAGLIVSESPFSDHALSEILPLQILFSATFFMSVGMLLDVGFLAANLPLVIGLVVLVLVVKLATTATAAAALGARPAVIAASSLMLAQVGEFSFVLERVGREAGLAPGGLTESGSQAFIAATVLLMVLTPGLALAGARIGRRLEPKRAVAPADGAGEPAMHAGSHDNLEDHVIIAGYGFAAHRIARGLTAVGLPFVITTLSPEGAMEAEAQGYPVLRGDASRQRTLRHAGIDRARMLVIGDDEPAMTSRVIAIARSIRDDIRIAVRTRREADIAPLRAAGTDVIMSDEMESIVQLYRDVLNTYSLDDSSARFDFEPIAAADAEVVEQVTLTPDPATTCTHTAQIRSVRPGSEGCEECVRAGSRWVHLRICMTCGHVGCCNSSRHRHATAHFHATGHPIMRSIEPGETWGWCHIDQIQVG